MFFKSLHENFKNLLASRTRGLVSCLYQLLYPPPPNTHIRKFTGPSIAHVLSSMKGKNIPHLFFTSIISPWTHALLTLGHIDHYSNPFHQFTHKVLQLKDKIDFLQKIFWCLTLKICTRPLDLLIFDSHWFTGLGLQISEVSWSLLKKNIILLSDWDIIKKKTILML